MDWNFLTLQCKKTFDSKTKLFLFRIFLKTSNFLRDYFLFAAENSILRAFIISAGCWGRAEIWRKQVRGGVRQGNDAIPSGRNEWSLFITLRYHVTLQFPRISLYTRILCRSAWDVCCSNILSLVLHQSNNVLSWWAGNCPLWEAWAVFSSLVFSWVSECSLVTAPSAVVWCAVGGTGWCSIEVPNMQILDIIDRENGWTIPDWAGWPFRAGY